MTWERGIAVLSNVMVVAQTTFPGAYVAPLALFAWVGLAAALCASWPQLRKVLAPANDDPGWVLPALAVMAVAGLAVRLLFCTGLPMVNSYGGLTRVVDAYAFASLDWSAQFQSIYPLGITSLAGAIMVVAGKQPGVYFSLVSLLSALLVPAIYLAARLLWGRSREALIAAAAAAIYPPLLAFSGSACLTVPYATLATLSVALLLLWLRTGSLANFCAFGFALLLTLQTRPEAVVFVVPVLAAPFLVRRLPWRELLTPAVLSAAALLVLLAAPFLAAQYGHYSGSSTGQGELGWQAAFKWLFRGGLAAAFLYWWGSKQERKGQTPRFTAAGVLMLALFLILEYHNGLYVLAGGGYPFRGFTQTDTYAPVEILFFNPKLTPLALILAYIVVIALLPSKRERRAWLFLHIWLVPLFAAGFLKRGGEVPFFGVRTTLSAAPAFLLVSARGVSAVVDQFTGKTVAGLALVAALTCVFPFFAGIDRTYNQQQEFLHLQTELSGVPDGSVVLYPADRAAVTVEGSTEQRMVDFSRCFRTRTLFAALLGDNERGIEYLPLAPDGTMPRLPDDRPAYFYQGLLCYRTGSSELTAACRFALDELPLAEPTGTTFPNRMYVADFFEDLRITGPDVEIVLHSVGAR